MSLAAVKALLMAFVLTFSGPAAVGETGHAVHPGSGTPADRSAGTAEPAMPSRLPAGSKKGPTMPASRVRVLAKRSSARRAR